MTTLKIIALLIIGGLFFVSSIKGLFSTMASKGDAPKSYGTYVSAAVRGRDPYKGPGKPLSITILGGLWTIFLFILEIPKKVSAHFLPKKVKWLSIPIAILVWMIFILVLL